MYMFLQSVTAQYKFHTESCLFSLSDRACGHSYRSTTGMLSYFDIYLKSLRYAITQSLVEAYKSNSL